MERAARWRHSRRWQVFAVVGTALALTLILYVQHRVSQETSGSYRRPAGGVAGEREAVKKLQQAGQLEKALSRMEKALERYPHDWMLLEKKGDILVSLGRLREAASSYEACVNEEPLGYWVPWIKLAAVQEEVGVLADAETTYRDLLSHYPGHLEAQHRLSRLLNNIGEHPDHER